MLSAENLMQTWRYSVHGEPGSELAVIFISHLDSGSSGARESDCVVETGDFLGCLSM